MSISIAIYEFYRHDLRRSWLNNLVISRFSGQRCFFDLGPTLIMARAATTLSERFLGLSIKEVNVIIKSDGFVKAVYLSHADQTPRLSLLSSALIFGTVVASPVPAPKPTPLPILPVVVRQLESNAEPTVIFHRKFIHVQVLTG
uniref:Uncharacterized protein n=1 Tax=Moniliophthora roreri TaxID=221103 RepID=A0A0W0FNS9_MONRR